MLFIGDSLYKMPNGVPVWYSVIGQVDAHLCVNSSLSRLKMRPLDNLTCRHKRARNHHTLSFVVCDSVGLKVVWLLKLFSNNMGSLKNQPIVSYSLHDSVAHESSNILGVIRQTHASCILLALFIPIITTGYQIWNRSLFCFAFK